MANSTHHQDTRPPTPQDRVEPLNPRLLEAVDSILERKPEATIVLFSDHGARYSLADPDEWHRSFLAARTPEHPALFADRPTPAGLLERLP